MPLAGSDPEPDKLIRYSLWPQPPGTGHRQDAHGAGSSSKKQAAKCSSLTPPAILPALMQDLSQGLAFLEYGFAKLYAVAMDRSLVGFAMPEVEELIQEREGVTLLPKPPMQTLWAHSVCQHQVQSRLGPGYPGRSSAGLAHGKDLGGPKFGQARGLCVRSVRRHSRKVQTLSGYWTSARLGKVKLNLCLKNMRAGGSRRGSFGLEKLLRRGIYTRRRAFTITGSFTL